MLEHALKMAVGREVASPSKRGLDAAGGHTVQYSYLSHETTTRRTIGNWNRRCSRPEREKIRPSPTTLWAKSAPTPSYCVTNKKGFAMLPNDLESGLISSGQALHILLPLHTCCALHVCPSHLLSLPAVDTFILYLESSPQIITESHTALTQRLCSRIDDCSQTSAL